MSEAYIEATVSTLECHLEAAVNECMRVQPVDSTAFVGAKLLRPQGTPPLLTPAAPAERGGWSAATWLSSLEGVNGVLAATLLSRAPNASELDALRWLGGNMRDAAELAAHLYSSSLVESLAACLLPALHELAASDAASTSEVSSKFAGRIELNYGGLDAFFGGLEGQVGAPRPQVLNGMETDHLKQPDSQQEFITGNYGVQTTSAIEWEFVMSGEDRGRERAWPLESTKHLPNRGRRRSHRTLATYDAELAKKNEQLRAIKQPLITREEVIAARLYTGPLFEKYNAVLRGLNSGVPFLRGQLVSRCATPQAYGAYQAAVATEAPLTSAIREAFAAFADDDGGVLEARVLSVALRRVGLVVEELESVGLLAAYDSDKNRALDVREFARLVQVEGAWVAARKEVNRYTTTLHAVNSAIVKLGKLTKATKVYRGVGGMALPPAFWEPNDAGVRGGIENAFMSTTLDKGVAVGYASERGGMGLVFEVQQGMVDRGADISWLSQYPHEAEILFGPLTGIEVQGTRVEGCVVIIMARLSVNLGALTIEEVIGKRKKLLMQMGDNMEPDVYSGLLEQRTGFEGVGIEVLRLELAQVLSSDAAFYNDDDAFEQAVLGILGAKRRLLDPATRLPTLTQRLSAGQRASLAPNLVRCLVEEAPSVRDAAVAALLHLEQRVQTEQVGALLDLMEAADASSGPWRALVRALSNVEELPFALKPRFMRLLGDRPFLEVAIRLRPFNMPGHAPAKQQGEAVSIVSMPDKRRTILRDPHSEVGEHKEVYADYAFWSHDGMTTADTTVSPEVRHAASPAADTPVFSGIPAAENNLVELEHPALLAELSTRKVYALDEYAGIGADDERMQTFTRAEWAAFDVELREQHYVKGGDVCFFRPLSVNRKASADSPYVTQQEVYDAIGHNLLTSALNGFNVNLINMGGVGSGKSFTAIGYHGNVGLLPRVLAGVFQRQPAREALGMRMKVECSYLIVREGACYDLLGSGKGIGPMIDVRGERRTFKYVESYKEVDGIMQSLRPRLIAIERQGFHGEEGTGLEGDAAVARARAVSGLFHTVFSLKITSRVTTDPTVVASRQYTADTEEEFTHTINLIDLASPVIQADLDNVLTGREKSVASDINREIDSLYDTLQVIAQKAANPKSMAAVPFDGPLQRLLQADLSGTAKTYVIHALSPNVQDYERTLETLARANRIKRLTI